MNKKIIFFDVDGTLVDVRPAREYVPESTIKAVRETRKKGNLCFLCTGRSLAEIYPHISVLSCFLSQQAVFYFGVHS